MKWYWWVAIIIGVILIIDYLTPKVEVYDDQGRLIQGNGAGFLNGVPIQEQLPGG